MMINRPPPHAPGEIKLNFSQAEVCLLKSHLMYAADRLQAEVERAGSHANMACTFQQIARLLRWQRYFTLLAGSLQPDHNLFGLLDVNLSSLLTAEVGPFLDFLRSERYRAEAAGSYIRVKPLDDLFKQEMLRTLDIEARFYGDLIDHIATPRHPRWQLDSEWMPLLFISLPRTLR